MQKICKLKWYIGIFCVAVIFSTLVNFINYAYVKKNYAGTEGINTKSLVYEATIFNIDNEWYLPQAKNYLSGHGFLLQPGNPYSAVRRTPGYPLFYLLHVGLLGEEKAHYFIRFTQIFLFGISSFLLALALNYILNNDRIALLAGYLYAVSPIIAGYNYYTITEAIHPAFVIFSFYFFAFALKFDKPGYFILLGLFIGLATLIRPTNGILLPAALLSFFWIASTNEWLKKFRRTLVISIFVVLGFSAVLLPWGLRNYFITKDFVLLERYYHGDSMAFGSGEKYVMKWLSSWSNRSQTEIYNTLLADTANSKIPAQIVSSFPKEAFSGSSKQEVISAFNVLRECIKFKVSNGIWRKVYMPHENQPLCEEQVAKAFKELTDKYKKASPFRYYIETPYYIKGKEFLFHSYSAHFAILNPDNGEFTWWQKIIKGIMYLLNLILWGSLLYLFNPFFPLGLRIFISIVVFGSLIFYVNVVTVEVRYMLIAYPFMYVTISCLIWKIIDIYKQFSYNIKIKHINV